MGFSVRLPYENIEWAGSTLSSLFAQKRNIFRPKFWQMIADILRFNKEAPALLVKARAEKLTLGQLLQQGKYSKAFSVGIYCRGCCHLVYVSSGYGGLSCRVIFTVLFKSWSIT